MASSTMTSTSDLAKEARPHFPALKDGYIYADSAGGSQCLKAAADKLSEYLLSSNVQLGADYSISKASTQRALSDGPTATAKLFNATSPSEIIFGSSSTQLVENLARALEPNLSEGDEIVISQADHEANIGPWVRLASRKKLSLKTWTISIPSDGDPRSPTDSLAAHLDLSVLEGLLSPRTRVVAFTACSNILGGLTPIKEIVQLVHGRTNAPGAGAKKVLTCVDCVAYAPHRRVDVRDWGIDFAFFSFYKVYGPHISAMYASSVAQDQLTSLAHFFIPSDAKPYKLQMSPAYEMSYSTTAVLEYLLSLSPSANVNAKDDDVGEDLEAAFARISDHEAVLMDRLVGYLLKKVDRGVRIVGPATPEASVRAPTVSFVVVDDVPGKEGAQGRGEGPPVKRMKSKDVVKAFDEHGGIGIRYGHFYAHRLMDGLGIDAEDGIVRISLVHYNTVEEVDKIVQILDKALG